MENSGTTLFDPGSLKSPQHLRLFQRGLDGAYAKLVDDKGQPITASVKLTPEEERVLRGVCERLKP